MKAIKERDPKNKDKYNIKYLTLTEVPEELVTSGVLFDDASGNSSLLNKCDAIIYIFESNDSEQVDFVKKANEKFKETDKLQFVPSILLQSKMDLQMPESGENRSMLGQTLASELAIKVYKEISATNHDHISETIDSVLMTCNEPACGLTESELAAARELDSGALSVYEFFNERPLITAAIVSVAAAGAALVLFMLKHRD